MPFYIVSLPKKIFSYAPIVTALGFLCDKWYAIIANVTNSPCAMNVTLISYVFGRN